MLTSLLENDTWIYNKYTLRLFNTLKQTKKKNNENGWKTFTLGVKNVGTKFVHSVE